MQLDKEDVTAQLRANGDHDRASAADAALPRVVDTERDASLLHQFDLSVAELDEAADPD